ncbi:hypothetical protein ACHAW6_000328 [Cyclotella cf. meneghiniana]
MITERNSSEKSFRNYS